MTMKKPYIDDIPNEFKAFLQGEKAKCIRCKKPYKVSYNWVPGLVSRLGNADPDVTAFLVRLKYIPNVEYTRQVALCGGCYFIIRRHILHMDEKKALARKKEKANANIYS